MFRVKKMWMGPDNKVFNEGFDNLFNIEEDYKIPAPNNEIKNQLTAMVDETNIEEDNINNNKEGMESAMDTVFGKMAQKFRKQENKISETNPDLIPNAAPSPLQLVQNGTPGVNIIVVEPRTFEDSLEIVNNLKERKSVIVNLQYLDQELSQRVIDFVSGATLALDGTQERVGHGVFIFASMNCTVQTEPDSARSYKDLFARTFS